MADPRPPINGDDANKSISRRNRELASATVFYGPRRPPPPIPRERGAREIDQGEIAVGRQASKPALVWEDRPSEAGVCLAIARAAQLDDESGAPDEDRTVVPPTASRNSMPRGLNRPAPDVETQKPRLARSRHVPQSARTHLLLQLSFVLAALELVDGHAASVAGQSPQQTAENRRRPFDMEPAAFGIAGGMKMHKKRQQRYPARCACRAALCQP
jgi:hypothetical protein